MAGSEAEQAAMMEKWGVWFGNVGSSLVDAGNPFTATAKSISSDGSVQEGPVGDTLACGYTIIKAESLDDAVGLAKGCPHLASGGQLTVYEVYPAM